MATFPGWAQDDWDLLSRQGSALVSETVEIPATLLDQTVNYHENLLSRSVQERNLFL